MSYHDAMKHGETNVGLGMVASKEERSREDWHSLLIERDRLKAWIADLQKGMYVNCVYCGHRYGPDAETPSSMADVLKEHIEQCPEHPMSALKGERDRLASLNRELCEALEALVREVELVGLLDSPQLGDARAVLAKRKS